MVLSSQEIKRYLKQLQISPDKWLGQHFLVDPKVYAQIIAQTERFLAKEDTILEVGPGIGTLTDELIQLAYPVIAVEKDPVFARKLKSKLNNSPHLTVIQGDILKQLAINDDLKRLSSWSVVANIPYAISSPLIKALLYRQNPPHDVLILVQKEMAERIIAPPGNAKRGVLSVECEIMAQAKIIETVPRSAFWPQPEVNSALLHLELRNEPLIPTPEISAVIKIARSGFAAKRKQLVNSLAGTLRQEKEKIAVDLQAQGINPNRRAETLTIDEWYRLTIGITRGV